MQIYGPGPRVSKQAFLLFRGILWATLLSAAILSTAQGDRAAAATQGTLAFYPSSANFQSVTVGTQKTISLTITNTGTASVVFSQESLLANDFSETGLVLPFTLAPGAHFTVAIKFLPKSAGQFTGRIVLASNATNSWVSYQMTGTGVAQSSGTLTATPSSASFGSVPLGSSLSQAVQLKNTGATTVTISAWSSSNSAFTLKGITTPLALSAGATANCTLVFTPTLVGTLAANMTISSNATDGRLTLALNGSGIAATRTLAVTPASLNFGNEAVGSSNTLSVTLKNTGNSKIIVSGVSATAADVVAAGGITGATLAPGQSATLSVAFAPKQAETVSGSVKISSNATGSPTSVGVAGTGVAGTGHSVALDWVASTSSNVSGYNIYRSTGLTGSFSKLTSAPVSGLKYTDTSVVNGETYVYAVSAVNSSGVESPHSTPVTAVIP
jgi:hypothetical protein